LELFVQLWNEGKTGLQMAEELGTTRSAVLGRAARMQAKGLIAKRIDKAARVDKIPVQPAEVIMPKRKPVVEPVAPVLRLVWPVDPEPPAVDDGKPIGLMDLKHSSCRFVVDNSDPQNALYCGRPKARKSYCADHAKLCYTKPYGKGDTRWRSLTRFQHSNFTKIVR
jgi:hypothetical protein